MQIEFTWLAYDRASADRAWAQMSIKELYFCVLKDEFRRKVNTHASLFHKRQHYLLNSLFAYMRHGAMDISLEEYKAYLFRKGVQDLPFIDSEHFLDFQIIAYFTTMRMADSYALAERIFTLLLRRLGILAENEVWTVLSLPSADHYLEALTRIGTEDLVAAADQYGEGDQDFPRTARRFLNNYMEFFHYARSNGFTPFCYSNYSNIRFWGDLTARKHARNERVVRLSFRPITGRKPSSAPLAAPPHTRELSPRDRARKNRNLLSLTQALQTESDVLLKQKAAESLAAFPGEATVNALCEVLREDLPELRQEAALVLREIGDRSALPVLLETLNDDYEPVLTAVALAILELGAEEASLLRLADLVARGMREIAVLLGCFPGTLSHTAMQERCIGLLSDNDHAIREYACFILGEQGDRKLHRKLTKLFEGMTTDSNALAIAILRLEARLHAKETAMTPQLSTAIGELQTFIFQSEPQP